MSWWIISGHKLAMASDVKHSSFNDDRVSMGPQPNSILHDPTTTSSAGIFAVRGISRHIAAYPGIENQGFDPCSRDRLTL